MTTSSFDKEGHRGCRGLMPENTIPAMLKAVQLGVTTLETDVVISKDNQVLLSHEPFFNHAITTKPDGGYISENEERNYNLFQMDYSEISKYDVGLKFNPAFPRQQKQPAQKPLLSACIDSVRQYCEAHKLPLPFFNIETKTQPTTDGIFHPAPGPFVHLLMTVIQEKNCIDHVIIQSFDYRTLKIIHQQYPGVKTAMLVEDTDRNSFDQHIKDLGFKPDIYSPHYSLVDEDLLKRCHQAGVKLVPWTIDDKQGIEKFRRLGVDGIITDYPDLF